MKTVLLRLFGIASFCVAQNLFASEPAVRGAKAGEWTQDVEAALSLAKARNLPVLLKFTGSDWCGWCKLMERNVFSSDEFRKWAAGRVVLVTIDQPHDESLVPEPFRERNRTLFAQYGIRGVPRYVVQRPDGTELGRLGASQSATPASFSAQFEGLVGKMPDKVRGTSSGASSLDAWLDSHCTAAQREAFFAKLSPEERDEFGSLVSAAKDRQSELDALAKERRRLIEEHQRLILKARKSDPATVADAQEKARAALAELDAAHVAKRREIEENFEKKTARFRELSARFK